MRILYLKHVQEMQDAFEKNLNEKLNDHYDKTGKLLDARIKKMENMLQNAEGVWFSHFWMKTMCITLGICYLVMVLYTVIK